MNVGDFHSLKRVQIGCHTLLLPIFVAADIERGRGQFHTSPVFDAEGVQFTVVNGALFDDEPEGVEFAHAPLADVAVWAFLIHSKTFLTSIPPVTIVGGSGGPFIAALAVGPAMLILPDIGVCACQRIVKLLETKTMFLVMAPSAHVLGLL